MGFKSDALFAPDAEDRGVLEVRPGHEDLGEAVQNLWLQHRVERQDLALAQPQALILFKVDKGIPISVG